MVAAGTAATKARGLTLQAASARNDSPLSKARLEHVFAAADPTQKLSPAWGVKEQLRRLLNTAHSRAGPYREDDLGLLCVITADVDETWRPQHTVQAWGSHRGADRARVTTPAQKPPTPASNTSNASAEGLRSSPHQARIRARRRRATRGVNPLTRQAPRSNAKGLVVLATGP